MKQFGMKGLTLLLVLTLLINLVPNESYADTSADITLENNQQLSDDKPNVDENNEILDLRTETSKTYLNQDGSHRVEISQEPIHFKNEQEQWQPIENELITNNNENVYENKANNFKVQFDKQQEPNTPFLEIEENNISAQMTMEPLEHTKEKPAKVEAVVKNESIVYPEIYSNIDIKYTVGSDRVKEDIIYTDKPIEGFPNQFTYRMNLDGLTVKEQAGVIYLYDINTNEPLYYFESPFMYDSYIPNGFKTTKDFNSIPEESKSYDVEIEHEVIGDYLYLHVIPNKDWLEDNNRVYPITIDPTIVKIQSSTSVEDTNLRSSIPTQTGGNDLELGGGLSSGNLIRSLLKFDLTSIPISAKVVQSSLSLWFSSTNNNSPINISLYKVSRDWNENEASWTYAKKLPSFIPWSYNGGDYVTSNKLATVNGLTLPSTLNADKKEWSIPVHIIQNWRNDLNTNFGFMIKSDTEAINSYKKFISSENSVDTIYKPLLSVTYTNLGECPEPSNIVTLNSSNSFMADHSVQNGQVNCYSFTPSLSGLYKIETNSYLDNKIEQNTLISVYKEDTESLMTQKIGYNDDKYESKFSQLYLKLNANEKVYINVNGDQNQSIDYRLIVNQEEDIDFDGLPDTLETSGIRIGYQGKYLYTVNTDPNDSDTDGDGLYDGIELLNLNQYNSTLNMYESIDNPTVLEYGALNGNFPYNLSDGYDWASEDIVSLKNLFLVAKNLKEKIESHFEFVNNGNYDFIPGDDIEQLELYMGQLEYIGMNYNALAEGTLETIREIGSPDDQEWVINQNWTFSYEILEEESVSVADVEPDTYFDRIGTPKYAWLGTAVHKAIQDKFKSFFGSKARTEYTIPQTSSINKSRLDMAYDTNININNLGNAYIWEIKPMSQASMFNSSIYRSNEKNQLAKYINKYEAHWGKRTFKGTVNQWNRSNEIVYLASYSNRYKDYLAYYYQIDRDPGFVYYIATKIPKNPDPAVKPVPQRKQVTVSVEGKNLQATTVARYKSTDKYLAVAAITGGVVYLIVTIGNNVTGVGVVDDAVSIPIATQMIRSGVTILRAKPL
ncbi:DNRLRE domain-containing protein [Peribacillus acanthi]|uniref:DNRLRE domain-containing protein n=1 Tax=Peribacillus acanthi TaxID=2171554 RepID=UPI000D3E1E51|nr:DNRLRE domain-containing protein [Peribacillus acanthi]